MRFSEFNPDILKKEGYDARMNGQLNLESCPYREDSHGEDLWIEGWRIADGRMINELDEGDDVVYENVEDFYLHYGEFPILEDHELEEAEYQGKKVKLGKPTRGDSKKYKVYVKCGDKVKKIQFGDKKGGLRNRRSSDSARKSFAARHNCKDKKDRCTAGYWSCRSGNKKKGEFW